ncbi:MAG: carboxypeptidase M32 [Myxococcota bacterium]
MSWQRFDEKMREIIDLDQILGLLSWDEETCAPEEARLVRGRQTGTLEAIRHQKLVAESFGTAIAEASGSHGLSAARHTMIQRMERRRAQAMAMPERLVKAFAEARSAALVAWQGARKDDQFQAFAPHLFRLVELSRERAQALIAAKAAPAGPLYDALLDEYEPGMSSARLRPVFAELSAGLVELLGRLNQRGTKTSAAPFKKPYDVDAQWKMTLEVLGFVGFDLKRGRQDRSTHPFSASLSEHDVRLTTRFQENDPFNALYSTIHEAGHGMYEQGWAEEHYGTVLASAPSYGLHESQSRLWENQVGRSRAFWQFFLPKMAARFPDQLQGLSVDEAYRAANQVEPGFIRTEADEVTYNLHIMLRFDLESALIDGSLAIQDLPGAWREKMKKLLGVVPPDDRMGCLQDIHWATGYFGYFPSYSIGNLYSAQLFAAFRAAHPKAEDEFARGEFGTLLGWLRSNVHHSGFLLSADETVKRATGSGLEVKPLLEYLGRKFGEVYRL